MLKVFSRQRILATKKGPADTAVPDVDDLNLSRIDQSLTSGTGHEIILRKRASFRLKARFAQIREGSVFVALVLPCA